MGSRGPGCTLASRLFKGEVKEDGAGRAKIGGNYMRTWRWEHSRLGAKERKRIILRWGNDCVLFGEEKRIMPSLEEIFWFMPNFSTSVSNDLLKQTKFVSCASNATCTKLEGTVEGGKCVQCK